MTKNYQDNSIMDIFGHFYLNHLSPLWGYFFMEDSANSVEEGGNQAPVSACFSW